VARKRAEETTLITRKEKARKLLKTIWQRIVVREAHAIPVFVFGEMRSGTNMLTDCLDRSMRTAIYNETDDEAFEDYVLRSNDVVGRMIERSRASHVVFKALADSSRAIELMRVFPATRAIWIFRNYQDVVNSAMRKWTEHKKYLAYILDDTEEAGWRSANLPKSLIEIIDYHYGRNIDDTSARALIWYVRNSLFFEQNLQTMEKVQLVRYENLVRAPNIEFERIFHFLGLPLQGSYFEAVSAGSISRDAAPKIDSQVAEICDELHGRLVDQLLAGRPNL
jgi:hypothetical protein